MTKIPATLNGETVYIVWFLIGPLGAAYLHAIFVDHHGVIRWGGVNDFTVLPPDWERDLEGSFVPPKPEEVA